MEVTCLSLKDLLNVRKLINNSLSEETDCIKEQKENICADRKKITPLKCESATAGFGGLKPDIIHITPIKQSEKASPDPWTPTANLKMLISAASPDIRDREMKKILFRPIENEDNTAEEEDEELDESCQLESLDDAEKRPSRKQKSLGLLCQKFLALYPDYPGTSESVRISLDEVATCLGVERRRIYDIVNVLESLLLVSRMAKNLYVWHGRSQLAQRLKELYQAGRESGYHLQMNGANTHSPQNMQAASSRRKDKSLRIMSQKFVMLFLVSKTRTVTLDLAAKILIEEGQDESSHSKYKTKVRRLYDIANVLTSLNLIKKLQAREEKSRKPVFKWIGPTDFCSESESKNNATVERREKMPRHSSFQVLPPPPVNLRPINSAPSTPHRDDDNPVDYSRKSAIRLHFGEGGSAGVSAGPAPLAVPLSAETPCPSLPLAYLPQTPLLMLYSGHVPEVVGQGQRSPVSVSRKRERPEEEEEEQGMLKRIHRSPSIESVMAESESPSSSVRRSPVSSRGSSSWDEALNETESGALNATEPVMSSHYLYVPTTTGLNNFNFLMSAGHNQSSMILPCFLLPSPLIAGTVPTSSADAGLRFNVPSVMSPARFVMAEAKTPSSPEHHGHELSPQRPQMHQSPPTSKTPVTPKDDAMSKSFFETPGDCDSLSIPPASRKKGSVHRRLDIGHTTAS